MQEADVPDWWPAAEAAASDRFCVLDEERDSKFLCPLSFQVSCRKRRDCLISCFSRWAILVS
jgi:hypothetical protein